MSVVTRWYVAAAVAVGFAGGAWVARQPAGAAHAAEAPAPNAADELAALKADVARLKAVVPDQSHAMADVAYHFTNLWAAGQQGNWPLAKFYADETRAHLRWAVRVIPKRKDAAGLEVDLAGMLAAFEQSTLKDLSEAVGAKDGPRFAAAYRAQMESCMACHRATGKEYIRLHVPERADSGVVEFGVAGGR